MNCHDFTTPIKTLFMEKLAENLPGDLSGIQLCGGAGDPTCASREFGEVIHKMIVDGLADVIKEFYDIQVKLENRKLSRECQKF